MGCYSHDVLLQDLLFFSITGFEEATFHVVQRGLWKEPYGKKSLETEGGLQPTALFYSCKEMNSANYCQHLSEFGSRSISSE